MHGQAQVNMKRDVTLLAFDVSGVTLPVHLHELWFNLA